MLFRFIIVVGDVNFSNGFVISGLLIDIIDGKVIVWKDDLVDCFVCYLDGCVYGINLIVEGDSFVIVNGKLVVLYGYCCVCGCMFVGIIIGYVDG